MRVGVVPNLERGGGGIYQYAVTLVSVLPEFLDERDELIVFLYGGEDLPDDLRARGYRCVEMRSVQGVGAGLWYWMGDVLPGSALAGLRRMFGRKSDPGATGGSGGSIQDIESLVDPAWRSFFAGYGVDLLIFTSDVDLAYRTGIPYVVAVHDIHHRLHPEFPEVSADGEWERREFRIGNCVRYAAGILVDSEVGKEDIVEAYGPDEDAVSIVPFVPASYLDTNVGPERIQQVRNEWNLPREFVFYPAAFWPHKNHILIVEAISLLRRAEIDVHIVLTGPNGGSHLRRDTFDRAMAAARVFGVDDLVHYLGYVDDETMSVLYHEASALVMPTFLGPTNIPVVEALKFGCPVITSNVRGIRDHVRGAALLVDPYSAGSIADGMRRVLENPELASELREAGYAHLEAYSNSGFAVRVKRALEQALRRIASRAEHG